MPRSRTLGLPRSVQYPPNRIAASQSAIFRRLQSMLVPSMLPRSSFPRSTFPRLAFLALAGAIALALLWNGVPLALAQNSHPQRAGEKAGAATDVTRGKYL